jgi:RNase P/RNase MRP subunit POP5
MPFDSTTLRTRLQSELLSFLGELNYGEAGIQMMNVQRNQGVIRMNHTHVDQVKTGLMMIQDIQGQQVNVRSVAVSGMLHKARGRLTL